MHCIAARQKEKATSSVTELLQAMKRPRALSESASRPSIRKSGSRSSDEEKLEQEQEDDKDEKGEAHGVDAQNDDEDS